MKLKYIVEPESSAGTAVPGCGTIHISEISDTLDKLSQDLSLSINLNNYILGSTGKKEYSGDIDLVIDKDAWNAGPGAFRIHLETLFDKESIARNGDMVHLRYPIVNYKDDLSESKPRTGFVQVDFNFGNADWERIYHHSPGSASEYKGAHRNLGIAAISAVNVVSSARGIDHLGRSISLIRWKFGPKGFIQVHRETMRDHRSGDWMRKQTDTIIKGPVYDPDEIAQLLFSDDRATADDLFSLETLMIAVKRYCGLVEQERIWRQMADNFTDWKDGRNFIYPQEIAAYITPNDK